MERVVYDRIRVLEQSHWWFAGRRKILTGLIGDLALPERARILERAMSEWERHGLVLILLA